MTITRLELVNFRSHAHTLIDLHPGVNVLLGESGQGKTNILRALRWLCLNEPSGDAYIRGGATAARVTATLEDGTHITRERTKGGTNRYIITRPGQEPMVLQGFGQGVPLEVQEALGVRPVLIDATDTGEKRTLLLHCAWQLDPPFLLSLPGADRAKAVGRVAGAHVVDSALRRSVSDHQAAQRREREAAAQVAGLDEQLAQFAGLENLEARLIEARALVEDARAKEARVGALRSLEGKYAALQEEMQRLQAVLDETAALELLGLTILTLTAAQDRLQALTSLQGRWQQNQEAVNAAGSLLASTARAPEAESRAAALAQAHRRLTTLDALAGRWQDLTTSLAAVRQRLEQTVGVQGADVLLQGTVARLERARALRVLDQRHTELWGDIGTTADRLEWLERQSGEEQQALEAARVEYRAALLDAAICPLCGQQLDEAAAERMVAAATEGSATHVHD